MRLDAIYILGIVSWATAVNGETNERALEPVQDVAHVSLFNRALSALTPYQKPKNNTSNSNNGTGKNSTSHRNTNSGKNSTLLHPGRLKNSTHHHLAHNKNSTLHNSSNRKNSTSLHNTKNGKNSTRLSTSLGKKLTTQATTTKTSSTSLRQVLV
jgi:hypothetical protein